MQTKKRNLLIEEWKEPHKAFVQRRYGREDQGKPKKVVIIDETENINNNEVEDRDWMPEKQTQNDANLQGSSSKQLEVHKDNKEVVP